MLMASGASCAMMCCVVDTLFQQGAAQFATRGTVSALAHPQWGV
jgi:hypothetical protein